MHALRESLPAIRQDYSCISAPVVDIRDQADLDRLLYRPVVEVAKDVQDIHHPCHDAQQSTTVRQPR